MTSNARKTLFGDNLIVLSFIIFFVLTTVFLLFISYSDVVRNWFMYDDNGKSWDGAATRTVILTIGGLWALWGLILTALGLRIAERRVNISQQSQELENLTRSLELLSNYEKPLIQIAGLRLLGDLQISSTAYETVIQDILADIIRTRKKGEDGPKIEIDAISLSINILSKFSPGKPAAFKVLTELDLRELNFTQYPKINLSSFNFNFSTMENSKLSHSNFHKAKFNLTNLFNADLRHANLTEALLELSILTEANLSDAILTEAHISRADLTRASLTNADLTGADLAWADLAGANLANADLTGANLINANLTGANLDQTNLSGAFLVAANLSKANLRQTQFTNETELDFADLTSTNLTLTKGLTQTMIDKTVYEQDHRPDLPPHLEYPTDREYQNIRNERVFVSENHENMLIDFSAFDTAMGAWMRHPSFKRRDG